MHDLILSPLAKGLFHQAIPQSGSGMGLRLPRMAEAEAAGLRFTKAAGATIAELRARTPEALAEIARKPEVSAALRDGMRFGPIADGAVIPEDPAAALAAGRCNDTPVLTGLTQDEGSAMDPEYRSGDAAVYRAALARRYGSFAARFVAVYPAEQPAVSDPALSRDRGIASMLFWAEDRRRTSRQAIFAYLFTHVEPGPDSATYGAFHSSEIPYVFGTLDRSPGRTLHGARPRGRGQARRLLGELREDRRPERRRTPTVAPAGRRRPGDGTRRPVRRAPARPQAARALPRVREVGPGRGPVLGPWRTATASSEARLELRERHSNTAHPWRNDRNA